MVSLFPDFKEFLRLLNAAEVRYLLVGGYAVNFYGCNRSTADIDFWIAVDQVNATRISQVLQDFGGFPADSVPPSIFLEHGDLENLP